MYATGTAANPGALLAAIEAFAVTAGFTVDRTTSVYNPGSGTPNDLWLAIHKGSALYLNYWYKDAAPGAIFIYGGTGYNGANAPDHQATPLQTAVVEFNLGRGPYTGYHLFSSTAGGRYYLHLAVEITGGLFGHLWGGIVNAVGGAAPALYLASTWWPYSGGLFASYPEVGFDHTSPFSDGTFSASQVLCTVDSVLAWFSASGVSPYRIKRLQWAGGPGWQDRGIKRTPNTFNELTVLFPMPIFLERATGAIWSWIGDLFDMRLCNMANPAPKDEVTIGSDTWKYFPFIAKTPPNTWNVSNNPPSSGPFGVAYRKNA